jgi:thiol-disulfide isomerase/thioredoxin
MKLFALLAALVYTFFTGAPQLVPNEGAVTQPLDWSRYQASAKEYRSWNGFVPIRRRPAHLTPRALFGYDMVFGNKNHSWILDRRSSGTWLLYIDSRGNGDLSDANPLELTKQNGVYSVAFRLRQGGSTFPCSFQILPHWRNREGKTFFMVSINESTQRAGTIRISGRTAAFDLLGSAGTYAQPQQPALQIEGMNQWQQYTPDERTLNLFGKSYAFHVRRDGSALTLSQLPHLLPERASLQSGSRAPAFSVEDIAGVTQSLSAYRGRIVLLDFWATYCHPCRVDEPHLLSLYRRTSGRGVAIVGIAADSSARDVSRFTSAAGARWPQIVDGSNGPMQRLYRVLGWPTYYLIGPDGKILATWTGGSRIDAHVDKYLHL